MPPAIALSSPSTRQRVAEYFASRPNLREVLATEGLTTLAAHCPWITHHFPQVQSLEQITVLHDSSSEQSALVDTLLAHFLSGQPMALAASDQLSITPPEALRPPHHPAGEHPFPDNDVPMASLNNDFDQLLTALVEVFQRAQVTYWNGCEDDSGITRLCWMAQLLKGALLANIEQQGLSDEEKALLYRVVKGTYPAPSVCALQITLEDQGILHDQSLPDLLINVAHQDRQLLLWCHPNGTVHSFNSLQAFGTALASALAETYRFTAMTWAYQPLDEDPFDFQAMQLLNTVLDNLGRLRRDGISQVSELQAMYRLLSDPSWVFCAFTPTTPFAAQVTLPAWLAQASANDRFEYQRAVLELAAAQALAKGATSLDDIEGLAQYAARRMREQMRLDHPEDVQPAPEHVNLAISQVVQISSTGPALLEPLRTQSLTALAIARLQGANHEVLTGISSGDSGPIPDWMTLDYVESLVDTVDIGGHYPLYVHAQLQDETTNPGRLRAFSTEWRTALLLAALKAKIEQSLSESAWYALAGFCRSSGDMSSAVKIAPLAFLCAPQASTANVVRYMFLLELPNPGHCVLYRPLLTDNAVLEFANHDQLMAKIQMDDELQRSVLAWLDDDAQAIYADGGFARPHLHRKMSELAHLLGGASEQLDIALQGQRQPASLSFAPWQDELDKRIYQARAEALVLLASRQSVSNAQLRWTMFTQLAWLAFDTLVPLLPGPIATMAWLLTSLHSIEQDMTTLMANNDKGQQVLAGVDLLINLAMLLAHRSGVAEGDHMPAVTPRLEGLEKRLSESSLTSEQAQQVPWKPSEQFKHAPMSVTRWSDNQRLGNLSAHDRQRLATLRANIELGPHAPETKGRLRGLYKVGERHYLNLQGSAYEVQENWSGLQIIGPEQSHSEWSSQWGATWDGYYITGRERSLGPWVTRWNGTWVLDLNLAGGMPKSRRAISEGNQQAFKALLEARKANDNALLKLDDLVKINTERVKPYDDAMRDYRHDLQLLPADQRTDLPAGMQARLQALNHLRVEVIAQLQMLALVHEKHATYMAANIELLTQMSEPRFARFDPKETARFARGQWSEQLLDNDVYLFHRLIETNDYETLRQQSLTLTKLPWGEAQAKLFSALRKQITSTLDTHRRLLVVSTRLDENILGFRDDPQVQFDDKAQKIADLVEKRHYSTLIVRAQIISDLTHLIIDRDLLARESFDELLRLQSGLHNRDLQQALLSHDGLATSELPQDEQAEILTNSLREYDRSLGMANYLQSLEESAINTARLDEYISSLSAVKALAERELSNQLSDRSGAPATPPQPVSSRPKTGKSKLIRTSRGKAILVQQEPQSESVVQTDPLTQQAVARYEQRGGQWFDLPTAPAAVHSNSYLQNVGTGLLARKQAQVALAARYAKEPNSLADLMDWHIQDMNEIATQLEAGPDNGHRLAGRLRAAVVEMEADKHRMLTDAYFNTRHPDSTALRYLVQRGEVDIKRVTSRKRLGERDYLDVYAIDRKAPKGKLWEAHFHYTDAQAAPRAFAKGHLKFWEPRSMGREQQLERSVTPAERIRIYRGDLRLAEVEGLIPFTEG